MHNTNIICLGDSFTRGFGVRKKENWISQAYPENTTLINAGINGDTTSGMLARFSRDVIEHRPDYVLITGGINDFIVGSSLDIPKNNYMAMAHQAAAQRIAPIIGIAPGFSAGQIRSDWAAFSDFGKVSEKHLLLRLWLHSFASTFHFPVFDFYAGFESFKAQTGQLFQNDLYLDGIHLTASGHKAIAENVTHMITKLLDKNTN